MVVPKFGFALLLHRIGPYPNPDPIWIYLFKPDPKLTKYEDQVADQNFYLDDPSQPG